MNIITSIVCILYCFDLLTESSRISIHDLNSANVFSSNFIFSFVISWTQKQTCIFSWFLQNASFYRVTLSRTSSLISFVAKVSFMCFICLKIFFDNTFRSVFFVHTCFSLYLIHVKILDCDVISLSVRFSLRILF